MTWKGPSAKMFKLIPVGWKRASWRMVQAQGRANAKALSGERVWNVLERGRRRVGCGRASHREGRHHALGG